VGHAAAALLIIGQPLVVLATVLLPPVGMVRRGASAGAGALWLLALVLLTVWGVSTHHRAVEAARTGAETDLLAGVLWLGLALCAAALSLLLLARRPAASPGA